MKKVERRAFRSVDGYAAVFMLMTWMKKTLLLADSSEKVRHKPQTAEIVFEKYFDIVRCIAGRTEDVFACLKEFGITFNSFRDAGAWRVCTTIIIKR